MRDARACLVLGALLVGLYLLAGCAERPGDAVAVTPTSVRAQRRAYDGAPPVIPHPPQSSRCVACHNDTAVSVTGLGVAPPNPHLNTPGMSAQSRCVQCHVFAATGAAEPPDNAFTGLFRPLHSSRAGAAAPPTIPHAIFMRESCNSCHSGPAARPEIRCTHPERTRCVQCHVPTS